MSDPTPSVRGPRAHDGARRDAAPHAARGHALRAAERLGDWVERIGLVGYDPYDALRSPLLSRLAGGSRRRQAVIQALRRLPANARPLLGIRPYANPKALGLIAAASAPLFVVTGHGRWKSLAFRAAERANELALPTEEGVGWAYPFDVQLRWGFYPANTPNAIATVFTASGLLNAAELLERPDLGRLAEGTASFLDALSTERGERFYAYFPGNHVPIHNANLLVAALRARLSARRGEQVPDAVAAAVEFSLRRQRPDGSWPYGEARGLEWVDGFHSAYVLAALADLHELTGRDDVESALRRGLGFYARRLFDADGAPRYFVGSRWPLDTHNAATAIATLHRLGRYDASLLALAERVFYWSLANLVTRHGWFVYQRGRLHTKRVPYLRWSNAHMLKALAEVASGSTDST